MRAVILCAVILGVLVLAASARAGEPVPGPAAAAPEADAALLASLEEAGASVTTIACDLVQEKHLTVFAEVLTSKGRFTCQRPDSLRWELTEPVRSGFSLRGNRARRWHERTGQDESFDVNQDPILRAIADQLLAWARSEFRSLRQEYRIRVVSRDPVRLCLEPQRESMRKVLDRIELQFASDRRCLSRVEVFEKDGDFTRVELLNPVLNGPLPDGLF